MSNTFTEGEAFAPQRSLFNALGFTKEEMRKPLVGIVSSYNEIVPGHMNIDKIVDAVKLGVAMAGGTPVVFPAIAVCDGIAMGHVGMKYSLVTRDLIADSTECMALAHQFDALVMVPNCDKNVPGLLMAAARVNVPTVFVSGGPMLAGRVKGCKTSLSSMFEAVGSYAAGTMTEEDVYEVGEEFFYSIFTNFSNKKVTPKHFPRISYKEAMLKYGTDKPDLRNPLEIIDISEIFIDSDFKPFRGATIRGIKATGIANNSNSWFNDVVLYANSIGMPGIGYISVNEDMSFKGPIDKFLSENDRKLLIDKSNISSGDVLFFIADKKEKVAAKRAGMIRTYLGEKLNLIDKEQYAFCIVNDFPFYEYDEEEDKYVFNHNPFSMPQGGLEVLKKENMENILAYQYDFVCNGCEMSSGAVRNHDIEIMKEAFNLVGYNEEVVKNKFKSLYTAFQYGPPPHAGMAPGIDRILMLLRDESNLREVQVFPPNVSGADNMMGSPNEISEEQLREVHIKLR